MLAACSSAFPVLHEPICALACPASRSQRSPACSVLFNFLGRDFFNALSAKDQAKFTEMLFKWLGALVLGIPVFVMR